MEYLVFFNVSLPNFSFVIDAIQMMNKNNGQCIFLFGAIRAIYREERGSKSDSASVPRLSSSPVL